MSPVEKLGWRKLLKGSALARPPGCASSHWLPPRDSNALMTKGILQFSTDIPHLHTPVLLLLESWDSIPGLRRTYEHRSGFTQGQI